MKINTTWSEVNQIIKEEFQRLMEKQKIQKRLEQINEELGRMEEEDQQLIGTDTIEEVEADGVQKVRSHAWTGEENGDVETKPKFEKKGSALMEDEDEEIEIDGFDEEGEENEEGEELDLSDEFAELGAAIEAKIKAALGSTVLDSEEDEEIEGEDFEEVEGGLDLDSTEEEEAEEEEEEEETEEEEVEEEPSMMSESKKGKFLNVLSEGLSSQRKSALETEMERMRRLAKL